MKKPLVSFLFFLIGLLATWVSLWIGSKIEISIKLPVQRASPGCNEIGLCSVAWWKGALFVIYIFGPASWFAWMGWRMGAGKSRAIDAVRQVAILVLISFLLFSISYSGIP